MLLAESGNVQASASSHTSMSWVDADTVASALLHVMSLDGTLHDGTCSQVINVAQPAVSLLTLLAAAEAGHLNGTQRNITHVPYPIPSDVWLPGTAVEGLYAGTAYANVLPFIEDTGRLELLGWAGPPWGLEAAVADAARFAQARVFESSAFARERSKLVKGLPASAAGSSRLKEVLLSYDLPVEELPAADNTCGSCVALDTIVIGLGCAALLLLVVWQRKALGRQCRKVALVCRLLGHRLSATCSASSSSSGVPARQLLR